jgi:hypothetical protein
VKRSKTIGAKCQAMKIGNFEILTGRRKSKIHKYYAEHGNKHPPPFSFNLPLYRGSEEEMSIFKEVIVSVILSNKVSMHMCPTPVSEIDLFHCTVQCKDEQHTMSSQSCKVH